MSKQGERYEVLLADSEILGDPMVWRYMDYPKFQDLLNRRKMFFTTKQGFSDKLEGIFGADRETVGRAVVEAIAPPPERTGPPINDEDDTHVAQRVAFQHQTAQAMRKVEADHSRIGISCWAALRYESIALWKSYTSVDAGIAIQSRLSKIRGAVDSEDAQRMWVGRVEYVEERPSNLTASAFRPLLYKSQWYDYEKEIRLMIDFRNTGTTSPGYDVGLDLDQLIEGVVVSPMAATWIHTLARDSMVAAGLDPNKVCESAIRGTAHRL